MATVSRSFYTCSHLVPVVVPAVGASYDNHPVFPTVWQLGGGGGECIHQPETQAEQGEEDQLTHVLRLVWESCVDDRGG